jgi:hypothetical protein
VSRLDLHSSASRLGHYRWLELQLFELLGAWAVSTPEPEIKILFGSHCHRHAWHAELWAQTLPSIGETTPSSLTAPASESYVEFVEVLGAPGAEQTIERLAGVGRVALPRLLADCTAHRAALSSTTDGPAVRSLTLVSRDLRESWEAFEFALQDLVRSPADAARAAAHVAIAEGLLADSGVTQP